MEEQLAGPFKSNVLKGSIKNIVKRFKASFVLCPLT
jgi:hypothetical protein